MVALILIQELENNPQSKLYVKYAMEAPEMMGFEILSAYLYKREVANNFFVEARASLVKRLLTNGDDSPNKEGQWILHYMYKHKSPAINPRPEVEEQINLYHGKLSDPAKAGIERQNFPSSDDFPNLCMHAVLGNIEHACGEGTSKEIQDRARQSRKAAISAAENVKAKEIAGRIANSKNLNAAVELGLMRWVTKSSIDESTCISSIEHTNERESEDDPFKPKGDNTNMFRNFYQPNPEQKILGAASLGSKGHYLFASSVAGHHSVSLILEKNQNGPLALGSPNYQLFWNDQFDDDQVPQTMDDGTSPGTLGQPRKGAELMRWIFRFTAGRRTDPTNRKFWVTDSDHTNYLNRAERGPETRKQIEDKAVERRCKNAIGIEIWHVVPK